MTVAARSMTTRYGYSMASELSALFDRLVELGVGARHERRLEALRDRLLGDHALGDVLARRQLEHHVEERGFDDRPQAACAGLTLERLLGDLPQPVVREDE